MRIVLFAARRYWRSALFRRGEAISIVSLTSLVVALVASVTALAQPWLFRDLPYPRSEELVAITVSPAGPFLAKPDRIPTIAAWRARSDLFQGLAGHVGLERRRFGAGADAFLARVVLVRPLWLEVLGVDPRSCRLNAVQPCLVLTAVAFERFIGGAPHGGLLDGSDGESVRLAAPLPSRFVMPFSQDLLWGDGFLVVDALTDDHRTLLDILGTGLIARLQPGVSAFGVESALRATLPDELRVTVVPLAVALTESIRPLALSVVAVATLLLTAGIASVTVSLVSALGGRVDEFGIRRALGADTLRLTLQLAGEGLCLALASTVAGVSLTCVIVVSLARLAPARYVALGLPTVNSVVLSIGVLASLGMIAVGLGAALVMARGWVFGRGAVSMRQTRFRRGGLVAGQCGLAVILLAGGVHTAWSLLSMVSQPEVPGNVTVLSVSYPSHAHGMALMESVRDSVRAIRRVPGVIEASATTGPVGERRYSWAHWHHGAGTTRAAGRSVTESYIDVTGASLLAGRFLRGSDGPENVVVNETFAKDAWGAADKALGESITVGTTSRHIVGVIGDERVHGLSEPVVATVYTRLLTFDRCVDCSARLVNYLFRLENETIAVEALRRAVAAASPEAIVGAPEQVYRRLLSSVHYYGFATYVLWLFAGTGTAMCIVGVAGLARSSVVLRVEEAAIRRALGAREATLLWQLTGEIVAGAATGAAVALPVAVAVSRAIGDGLPGATVGGWLVGLAGAVTITGVSILTVTLAAWSVVNAEPSCALKEVGRVR